MIEQLPTYQLGARTRLTGMVVKMAVNGGAPEQEGESKSASQSRSPFGYVFQSRDVAPEHPSTASTKLTPSWYAFR
jgi:hypothetical protein